MLTGNLPKQLCASLIVTLALCSGMVTAEPLNGIGTYVGLVGATENGVGSSGLSLGADAQFTINDNWSLVPYLMI